MDDPVLRLTTISKSYPGVRAVDRVSLSVRKGEVLALIGENGAGKSTLMKILGGVVKPDSGAIQIDGRERASLDVADSMASGIAFVHQELNLFDNLDVGANVLIGREPLYGGPLKLVDRKATRRIVDPLLKRLDVDFEVDDLVSDLSLAQRQLLEIVKALSLNARIVIMDEPTSSLTSTETERLMRIIGELKADGVSVIFITHRLNEVERCADRAVVLRDGSVVGELDRAGINHDAMIRLMIGRDLKSLYIPPKAPPGEHVLEVIGLRTPAHPKHALSISLQAGEILGMAGLIGAGRTELARTVFGIDAALGGEIRLNGAPGLGSFSPRRHLARDLSRPGGSQTLQPGAGGFGRREHFAGEHESVREIPAHRPIGGKGERIAPAPIPQHQDGVGRNRGRHAVGRKSAESRTCEMAVDEAQGHDVR